MNKIIFIFSFFLAINSFSQNKLKNNSINVENIKPQSAVFEENKGQMKDQFWKSRLDVLFYGASEGMNYFIKNNGMSYQLSRVESWKEEEDLTHSLKEANDECKQVPDQIGTYRVDADWLNANPSFEVVKGKELDGYNNYYNVPKGVEPALYVKKYEAITLKNVWDGIDLHYYGTEGFLETDYLVAPGADYKKIQIQFKGAELSTDEKGNLIIKTPFGEIQEGTLKVYQNNERIEAYWKISKDNVVSFEIPNYNADLALRIDPLTRVWGTYYGGSGYDYAQSTVVDVNGNLYLSGTTASTSLISSGGFQNVYGAGLYDAFVVKFTSFGIRVWGSYYGGNGTEYGKSISTDASGNIYLAGETSSSASIASGGHQNTYGGSNNDAFLVKFNSSGIRIWGTYYGGSGSDIGQSLTVDASGNIYLTGVTNSTTGIAFGGHQMNYGTGTDAFLVKFNSNGVRLWGTYYGGSGYDATNFCKTDGLGNIYITGWTNSNNSIAIGGHQNIIGGGNDAFLVKFNSTGVRIWATYYGGNADDGGGSISIDDIGNIYMVGGTSSNNNISSNGFQNNSGGAGDAFIVKFNSSGQRIWGSFLGGSQAESANSCIVDITGNIYLAGRTASTSGIALGGFQNYYGGGTNDAFMSAFNSSGNLLWSSYFGGTGTEYGNSIIMDATGNIYLSGETSSVAAIASSGYQNNYSGGRDAFLEKFCIPSYSIETIVSCEPYTWVNGITYSSNNYTDSYTFQNTSSSGCDSIVQLNLTINQPSLSVDSIVACNSYTWINGQTYYSSNYSSTYSILNGAMNGCDSIIELHLQINYDDTTWIIDSSLNSYTYNNQVYYNSGVYLIDTILNSNGCQTLVYLDLTILNSQINELEKYSKIKITPNPATSGIKVFCNQNFNQSFSIFDQMGREVFKGKLTGTETEVNLSMLSKGIYTLKIEGNYQPAQIVKE
jgi:hypothetical protein